MIQETLAAVQAAQPLTTTDASQVLGSQLASAALLAYLLKWVQGSDLFPWISEHTKGINRALTGAMSLIAAIGISYSFDAATGVLTIGGLHASSLLAGLWAFAKQWAFQQGAADMIFTKSIAADVQIGDVGKPTGVPPPATVTARTGTGNGG